MNIIITGGAGFIGSNLVDALVKTPNKIIIVDRKITPKSIFWQHSLQKKVEFVQIDIRDKKKVFDIFKIYKPSYVTHLAAQTIVTTAFDKPMETFETNILGSINIFEACRVIGGVKRIVFASSDKAYGKTKKTYTEDSPLAGDHPYDVSKSSADLIAQTYYKTYNLPIVIARFGNVYGEGDLHFDRIIPGLCKAIVNKNTFAIRSDGQYIRDYVYVKDVVDGYLFLLTHKGDIEGQAYNFSSQDTLSVLEVIEKAQAILGVKIPYKILNVARNEIPYQHLDNQKVKSLGWKNEYSLEKTLPGVLNWYSKIL
ncbi:MAG: GDP-mannose 4,6-dehydratase [Candidatus Levyibacteriota bacterium]|nr:MAG: GDP-mannose 4,6-dehydratase [Candidatus Levybacteria bacterium]